MSTSQFRKFYCQKHPEEAIQRVFLGDISNPLLCVACLLSRDPNLDKSEIKSFKVFVDEVTDNTLEGVEVEVNRQDYHEDYEKLLKSETETIARLSDHIAKEKEKVDEQYEHIKEKLLQILQKKRVELLDELDNQLYKFKMNFARLRSKINKFYHGESDSIFTSKHELIDKINSFEHTNELEAFLSSVIEEFFENKSLKSQGKDYVDALKENIENVTKEIKSQIETFPTSALTNQAEYNKIMKSLNEEFNNDLIKATRIENPVFDIYLSKGMFDSEILKRNHKLISQLKSWIVPEKNVKLKLLWRGSKDGWDMNKFRAKCGYAKPNLVLIKVKENEQIIGGYTDQDWSTSNDYKQSTFSFIFNLSQNKKHKIKKYMISSAIYSYEGDGMTFGEGPDLYLGPTMTNPSSCSSNMGYTFGSELDVGICGMSNFSVEEFEFFECEHRKLTTEDEVHYVSNESAPVDDLGSDEEGSWEDNPVADEADSVSEEEKDVSVGSDETPIKKIAIKQKIVSAKEKMASKKKSAKDESDVESEEEEKPKKPVPKNQQIMEKKLAKEPDSDCSSESWSDASDAQSFDEEETEELVKAGKKSNGSAQRKYLT